MNEPLPEITLASLMNLTQFSEVAEHLPVHGIGKNKTLQFFAQLFLPKGTAHEKNYELKFSKLELFSEFATPTRFGDSKQNDKNIYQVTITTWQY